MYKKVLVPVDGSHASEAILPYAAQLAGGLHAEVTVFHVTSLEKITSGNAMIDQGPDAKPVPAKKYLEDVRLRLEKQGVRGPQAELTSGEPTVEIIRYAESKGYDLIAMATHGRGGVGRWVFGSTADKVLHASKLPILLIRPKEGRAVTAKPVNTVFVPLDGSPLAESVLPTVEDLAKRLDLPVVLMQVVPHLTQVYGGYEPYAYDPKIDQQIEDAAGDYLKKTTSRLTQHGVRASYEVFRGYAAAQILDAADKTSSGMIVMATHGRSGVGRWILGSVADRVLRASPLPVLLLRAGV